MQRREGNIDIAGDAKNRKSLRIDDRHIIAICKGQYEGQTERDGKNTPWKSTIDTIAMEAGTDLTITVSKIKDLLGKIGGLDEIANLEGALRGNEPASGRE